MESNVQLPLLARLISELDSSYLLDDPSTFKELRELYRIDFPRQKLKFDEWHQNTLHNVSAMQRVFWKPVFDSTNGLTRTAFGLDFATSRDADTPESIQSKVSGVSSEWSVLEDQLQRLSIYLQLRHRQEESDGSPEEQHESHETGQNFDHETASRRNDKVENNYLLENTIIVFLKTTELYPGGAFLPELVPWNELLENTNLIKHHANHPIALAIIELVFEAVSTEWDDHINSTHREICALEERIYQNPADDAQSTALWSVSREILQAERLLTSHLQLLETIQDRLAFLITFDRQESTDWLKQQIEEYQRLRSNIEESLKKPSAHIIYLMYKSVSIRDARQSLETNNSLWRLSWITFIFLPLTFLVGFFGMNVDTFQKNPSLKWYFISVVPLMIVISVAWLATKHWMRKDVNALQAMRKVFHLRF